MVSRCIATIDQERGVIHSLAVMKNKRQFVSAADLSPSNAYSWSIKLWDIETRQCVRTFANFCRGRQSRCRVIPLDDESFVCFFHEIDVLVLYNVESDNHVKTIELDYGASREEQLAVLDQDRFLTGNDFGDVKVWSFETGERQRTLHFEDNYTGVHSISKCDDESFLCGFLRKVLLCNVETGEVMKSFDVDGLPAQIDVIDSKRFLTVQRMFQGNTWCPKVNVWNANSGELIQRLSTNSNVLQAIPVRGHGVLLRYYNNANIELWGDEMRNLKRCFVGHEEEVLSIDLVNDATFISGSRDGTIKIWDLSRWPDLKTLICLRKLFILGRAQKVPVVRRSKRLRNGGSKKFGRDEISPFLHALVCETSAEIFRTVLSFLA